MATASTRAREWLTSCASTTTAPITRSRWRTCTGCVDLAGKGDTPARIAQVHRFADLIGGLHRPGERLVVCGDLNARPDGETLAILAARLGLIELVTAWGFEGTRTSLYTKPERFADYMLVGGQVRVNAFDVLREPEVSDHATLILDAG